MYSSNVRPLTVNTPVPGTKRTRATEFLRRPVPKYCALDNVVPSLN